MRSIRSVRIASLIFVLCLFFPYQAFSLPDIAVYDVEAPEMLFYERENPVSARVRNIGDEAANNFYYRVVLSRTTTINLYDEAIFEGGPISLDADDEIIIEPEVTVPDTIASGSYYLGFILDPLAHLEEANRVNNAMPAAHRSLVRNPAPDLRVLEVRVGNKGAAGETLRVNFTIENRGNLDAEFDYGIYLSHNEIISREDVLLYRGAFEGDDALLQGSTERQADYVLLPAGLPAGLYHLGVIADPDENLDELDRRGNVGRAAIPLEVEATGLHLANSWLPEAVAGQLFTWSFVATGGVGQYEFSVVSGQLPPGVELDAGTGEIQGVPEDAGEWPFVLEVRSGGLSIESGFIFRVIRPSISLTVNTDALPPAILQVPYRMLPAAVGGIPPYQWSATSLPPGLSITQDGVIEGEPMVTGWFTVDLTVRDDAGTRAGKSFNMRVVDRGTLAIITGLLPSGMVGEGYSPVGMEVMGATGFVSWTIIQGNLPPGISLEPDSGIIRGIPSQAGRFAFSVRARDEAGLSDINSYTMEILTQPISIVTQVVGSASVGEEYEQGFQILPGSGKAPFTWSLLSGHLPEGLELSAEEGIIRGVPEEDSEGLYTFGIRVRDISGAEGMRAYVLEVSSDERNFDLSRQPEPEGGCNSFNGAVGMAFLIILMFFMMAVSRKRGYPVALLLLALSISPEAAFSDEWAYSVVTLPEAYEEISGGSTLGITGSWDGKTRVTLPFDFEFYGQVYDGITVSVNGLIGFEPFSSSHFMNHDIPSAQNPNGILALWWDDLDSRSGSAPGADISTKVLGNAPSRIFVVQWKNVARGSGSQLNFQARLHEGSSTIEARYGSYTGAAGGGASAGIENQNGTVGLKGLACTPSCTQGNFPSDTKILYATMPNLVASDLEAPATVWSGVPVQIHGVIANVGGEDAGPFDIKAVIGEDPGNLIDGIEIGRTRITEGMVAGQSMPISMIVEIPEDVESDMNYWISLIPNPDGEVDEAGAGMNLAPPIQVRVGPPMPNLRVMSVVPGAQEVLLGDSLTIDYEIANSGNLEADTEYWIVISVNNVITTQDLILHQDEVLMEPRSNVQRTTSVEIPSDLAAGSYFVGIILDPGGNIYEPDVSGNARASAFPVSVTTEDLIVVTESLPTGRVGSYYSARLRAIGGGDRYRWRVASGALPPGVSLSEDGWISGRPEAAGAFFFQILVRSEGLLAVDSFTVYIEDDTTPLTIVSGTIPSGAVGFDYYAALFAVGGEAPYSWLALDDIPLGLIMTEDGRISGIPREPGDFTFQVRVTDRSGDFAETEVEMEINMTGHLLVTTYDLPRGILGEEYEAVLSAAGGREPYRWAIDGTGVLPEGLNLGSNGIISGTPEQIGFFDVVIMVRDERGQTNRNTFGLEIGYSQGISITTINLPNATGGWEYEAELSAWGGSAPYVWHIVSGSLPDGLSLDEEDGIIYGIPVDDGVHRYVPFIVNVMDAAGRTDRRAMSISVGPAPDVLEPEGCATFGGGGKTSIFLLMAGAFILFGLGYERKGSFRNFIKPLNKGAGIISFSLLVISMGILSGCGSRNPCEDVVCPVGSVCSEADGECMCGGPGGDLCAEDEICDPLAGLCRSTVNPCDGVFCADGFSCDPDDGICKCGGAGGEICGENESCNPVTGFCIAPDPCADLICPGEEYCKPETGQCRCGEMPGCAVGERCESGECISDLCYGIICSGGNICDPEDGICRCGGSGGPVCDFDEVCNPSTGECLPAATCMGIMCSVGMSCDPTDGICKCGGPEGIPCRGDQVCEPRTGLCMGGDPCVDVECPGGTTCDPEDGLCRCGGYGGEICDPGDWCVEPEGMDRLCSPSCSPVFQDCEGFEEEDIGCYYDDVGDRTFCAPAGNSGEGSFCIVANDCEPGLHCTLEGSGRRCRMMCDTAAVYPQPGSCHLNSYCSADFEHRSEIGVCVGTGGS